MTNKTIQRAIDIAGSQKKLADLCGIAQPTVWRWLHGGGIDVCYVMNIVSATNGKIKPADNSEDFRCAEWLFDVVQSISSSARKPNYAAWANDICSGSCWLVFRYPQNDNWHGYYQRINLYLSDIRTLQ